MASIWDVVTQKTMSKLKESGIEITFNNPKNDDSHVKAKTGVAGCYWAFARSQDELWVELEIKPRTVAGKKVPQEELFESLLSKKKQMEEQTELVLDFSEGGGDRRIKSYVSVNGVGKLNSEDCAGKMKVFVTALLPRLQRSIV